jgi:hypothetical protein
MENVKANIILLLRAFVAMETYAPRRCPAMTANTDIEPMGPTY